MVWKWEQARNDAISEDRVTNRIAVPIPMARETTITEITEAAALVSYDGARIVRVETHPNLNRRISALVLKRIAKFILL